MDGVVGAEEAVRPSPTGSGIVRRSAVGLFLAGTFGWAWLLWGYWVVAMPPGGLQVSPAFIVCAIAGGFAPSLAAIAVSFAQDGRAGVGTLLRPLLHWRIGWGMAATIVLLVPVATAVSVALQAAFVGPLKAPDPAILFMALIWPLMAALGEELGWRGYLMPRLHPRFSLLAAALVTGFVWGVWHLPADYVALKGYGGWFWAAFLLNGPVVLTAHAIIMAWIWKRTGGSTLAAVLYHVTITVSAMIAPAAGSDGLPGVLAAACGAGVMGVVAATLFIVRRRDFAPAAVAG